MGVMSQKRGDMYRTFIGMAARRMLLSGVGPPPGAQNRDADIAKRQKSAKLEPQPG
jgi:hypothetical protein